MWIFTPNGFLSVVRDNQKKGHVLIRARAKADIWNLYRRFHAKHKMSRPKADENRDYRWRVSMKKRDWARIAYKLSMEISYTNFKNEVHTHADQENKNSAYLSVWSAMLRVQHGEDHLYRTQSQQHFNSWTSAWDRELDFVSGRFDAQDPVPTKTIKSVLKENQDGDLVE
jgi:hypothetical protein